MTEHGGDHYGSRVLLGLQLRQLREWAGMNAWQAADKLGIAKATVWRLEGGDLRSSYKWSTIERIGRLYGITDETLVELSERARAVREGH
jgi:DNA-binding XRE family transcriptional regulator